HNTPGTITSEGAHFFLLTSEKDHNPYSQLTDVALFHTSRSSEVLGNIQNIIQQNNLNLDDIDLVILGNNGDSRFDHYYHDLQHGVFQDMPQICFNRLGRDYNTVTDYAMWLGSKILRSGIVPGFVKCRQADPKKLRNILIYNHYLGENHSVILL